MMAGHIALAAATVFIIGIGTTTMKVVPDPSAHPAIPTFPVAALAPTKTPCTRPRPHIVLITHPVTVSPKHHGSSS